MFCFVFLLLLIIIISLYWIIQHVAASSAAMCAHKVVSCTSTGRAVLVFCAIKC